MEDECHVTAFVGEDGVLKCGCVVRNCWQRVMVSPVGSAWVDAMADSAVSMVESTAHP